MEIIVTGTSRGIGYEIVKHFAAEGDHRIFIISRNKAKLDSLATDCRSINPNTTIVALPFDLEDSANFKNLHALIASKTQHIDILINNAGFLVNKAFEQLHITDVEKIFSVNVFAPLKLIQIFLPLLKVAPNAHVVNISSMGGYQGSAKFPGLAPYSSSKAAIASLTECLAEEYKETRIKFNCLALGAVATEMLAEAFPGYEAPTSANQMAEYIADFAINGHKMFNGKIIPVSNTTP